MHTSVKLLLRRLMREVIKRMFVMQTNISLAFISRANQGYSFPVASPHECCPEYRGYLGTKTKVSNAWLKVVDASREHHAVYRLTSMAMSWKLSASASYFAGDSQSTYKTEITRSALRYQPQGYFEHATSRLPTQRRPARKYQYDAERSLVLRLKCMDLP